MARAISTRAAIVTGAARGIGRAIALRLAADGIDVAVNDLPGSNVQTVAQDVEKMGRRSLVVHADVRSEAEVAAMVDKVAGELGGVDIMVANAGIVLIADIFDTPLEDFERILRTNLIGTFLCYKYAAKMMMSQGRGGRIIGACSLAGLQAHAYSAAYATSKFAIRGLTQTVAADLRKHGITVNAYAPGVIDTDMGRDAAGKADIDPDTLAWFSKLPVGRPEDVANAVSFLVSDQAGFITGQTVPLNGGAFFS